MAKILSEKWLLRSEFYFFSEYFSDGYRHVVFILLMHRDTHMESGRNVIRLNVFKPKKSITSLEHLMKCVYLKNVANSDRYA